MSTDLTDSEINLVKSAVHIYLCDKHRNCSFYLILDEITVYAGPEPDSVDNYNFRDVLCRIVFGTQVVSVIGRLRYQKQTNITQFSFADPGLLDGISGFVDLVVSSWNQVPYDPRNS